MQRNYRLSSDSLRHTSVVCEQGYRPGSRNLTGDAVRRALSSQKSVKDTLKRIHKRNQSPSVVTIFAASIPKDPLPKPRYHAKPMSSSLALETGKFSESSEGDVLLDENKSATEVLRESLEAKGPEFQLIPAPEKNRNRMPIRTVDRRPQSSSDVTKYRNRIYEDLISLTRNVKSVELNLPANPLIPSQRRDPMQVYTPENLSDVKRSIRQHAKENDSGFSGKKQHQSPMKVDPDASTLPRVSTPQLPSPHVLKMHGKDGKRNMNDLKLIIAVDRRKPRFPGMEN